MEIFVARSVLLFLEHVILRLKEFVDLIAHQKMVVHRIAVRGMLIAVLRWMINKFIS